MAFEHDESDITRSHIQLASDTIIGHYRIIEKIGAGGMGEIYLARDTELNRNVALKFLPPYFCEDVDCRARFKREAQAAAKLDHPNIVTVHEVGEFQGRPFFSMQHVEGQSLKEVMAGKTLAVEQILQIGIQICEGLQEAHEKEITHRDIKPSNILIDSHGRARIVDFGLASIYETERLTKTGSTLGTIGYMSPEQVGGERTDHRTDLFSLGVVLYEMITGYSPFKAESEAATLHAIINNKPELLARFRREVPSELQTIIDKALEKNVATRYQHADELAADLKRLMSPGASISTGKPSRYPWNRYLVTSVAAVLLVITGYWLMQTYILSKGQKQGSNRKMLAVLPFQNLGSPQDEYFAEGITDEITTCLAGLSGLGIISRTSSAQYKSTDKSLRQIGKELGIEYVLEGTIRWDKKSSENRVRINPRLVRVSDDSNLWANSFDAILTDVFEVQSTIAQKVAAALDVTLLQPEQEALFRKTKVDAGAYDYYLRGKQYFSIARYQQNELRLAEIMHLKAIELAPDFAPAYTELGALYTEMFWDLTDPSPQRLDSAKRMIDMAMRLAPRAPETHEALGWYYYHGLRDYERALNEFVKVLERQPNNVLALASTAWVQRRQGKWEEAIRGLQIVTKLAPRDAWYKYELGITYNYCHRYPDAIAQFDQAIDLQPNHKWAYLLKSWALFSQTGDTRQARGVLDTGRACNGRWPELTWIEVYYDFCDGKYDHALSLMTTRGDILFPEQPDSSDYYYMKGVAFELVNRQQIARACFDSARALLESSLSTTPDAAPLLSSLARVYARLGQGDKAVQMAQRASSLVSVSYDALDGPNYVRNLAMVYAQVGESAQAIELFDYLLKIPANVSVNWLRFAPELTLLRDNPRFQAMLKKHERLP